MDLQVATLCDFAAEYQGKMVISGTFDALAAKATPIVHPQCSLAMRFCFTPEDDGNHDLQISIIDEDGKPVNEKMPIKGAMPVQIPDNVAFMTRHLIVGFQGLTFPRAGVYSVDIIVDDELIQRLPLRIIKVDDNQQSQPPQG
ncbi:MAG: FimD/PapC N-terminal domain-containing protein [Akkermansiaceae bacterium]|jgi:hypothetical protein|nr:FimD/PapC N-terminal domain-containing protein [Akkermansiaceae bacterium]MDB4784412.1 FimD/PapC N-terminal domain-containing protein [Akkermansiaceae bacterium]HAN84171.1 hypothetical protein [Verrucomicrobiales bacterium]HBF18417.1 hypothetical protein [Verrucomicrobiales bacterium]